MYIQDKRSLSICVLSLPQEIEMFGQSLEVCRTAQEARRVAAKAALNAAPALLQLAASLPRAVHFPNPNDMAAASMADMATGVIPPLPKLAQAEAAAAGIFEVTTEHHCDTLVLMPMSTGIDETRFCSLFNGEGQIQQSTKRG
jgi:hypothetical protein